MPAGSLSHPQLLHSSLTLSHRDIAASNTQGCALLTKFPVLIHFIFPFPGQLLGQKLLLSSVTSFASLNILFIFICFPLLYVLSCLLVGSITGQEVARHFYHTNISNWDLPGSVGHCVCPRTGWGFNHFSCFRVYLWLWRSPVLQNS